MSPFLDTDPLGFGSAGFFLSIGYRLNICSETLVVKKLLLAGVAALSVLSASAADARPQVIVGKPKVVTTYFTIGMLPPAKYDVPYEGDLEIRYYSSVEALQAVCPKGPHVYACTQPTKDHKRCSFDSQIYLSL
jgi:hypothetical protein